MNKTGIQKALDFYRNNPAILAIAIGDGVTRQAIEGWLKSGRVPHDYCPKLEKMTGIPCEELRPTGKWDELRALRKTTKKEIA